MTSHERAALARCKRTWAYETRKDRLALLPMIVAALFLAMMAVAVVHVVAVIV